jgi:phytoene dehydrogenase-like protein
MRTYVGVDYHRNYSYLTVMDERGRVLRQGTVENRKQAVTGFLASDDGAGYRAAVLEATRNWAVMRDWLEELVDDRSSRGLNFFSAEDQALIETLARGEFNLRGFQNKSLRALLSEKTSGQVSRLLKRLRLHDLIKKVGHTYRYYLTLLGKQVIASGLKLKNLVLIPELAAAPAH